MKYESDREKTTPLPEVIIRNETKKNRNRILFRYVPAAAGILTGLGIAANGEYYGFGVMAIGIAWIFI